MRVVGGRFRGRPLKSPDSDRIRPTSDRLRESLFNILEHGHGGLEGRRVIDLFAGTGALAIEALSRGARYALLVDDGPEARAAIRANIETLGLGGVTRVFRRDARKLGHAPQGESFDRAFLDPPYGLGMAEPALEALRDGGWLDPDAIVVVEEALRTAFVPPAGYLVCQSRTLGDTQLTFLRVAASP